MADYYQSEDDLNNDLRRGYEPGTTARQRAEGVAKAAARQAEVEAMVAGGMSRDLADLISQGYTRERAEEVLKAWAEDDKRCARNAKRQRGREYRYTNAERARDQRLNSLAYRAGYSAGASVSLNRQADHVVKPQIG